MIELEKLYKSFFHAYEGIIYAFHHNQNLRIHFYVALLVMIASLLFRLNAFDMGILGVVILLVISSEMINCSIEQMVDLITVEHRKEAKIAKDVAAGMVLLTSVGSIVVGTLIFFPYIVNLLK